MSRALLVLAGGLLLGLAAFVVVGEGSPGGIAEAAPTSITPTTSPPRTTSPTSTTSSPSSTSTTTTTSPATSAVERGQLVIHGAGDVNTDTSYIPALAANGPEHAWSGLEGLFADDDLTVVNLECTPSALGEPLPKEFVFRCDPASLPAMAEAGVDVVSLANNHSGDHGKEALVDGRDNVVAAGLAPVGVGRDAAQASAPAVFAINGWRIAVVGFGGVMPSGDWVATADTPGMADGDTIETMVEAVKAADAAADLVVVTIHWGVERDTEPRVEDRRRAEALIEAGADIIFGHHPHRLQPLEVVDGAPVAWSLGNFVWPNLSPEGSTTAVARVVVAPNGGMEACLIPAFITSPGHPEITGNPPC